MPLPIKVPNMAAGIAVRHYLVAGQDNREILVVLVPSLEEPTTP